MPPATTSTPDVHSDTATHVVSDSLEDTTLNTLSDATPAALSNLAPSEPIQLSVSQTVLAQALSKLNSVIPMKAYLPILGHLLIDAKEGVLRLTATDIDTTMQVVIPAYVSEDGRFTLPLKKLSELVKTLPPKSITVVVDSKREAVRLTCGQSKFRLFSLPHEEFPLPAANSCAVVGRIRADDLQSLINHTAFAASSDENRPILQGVLWQIRPTTMRMVATDGHRMACVARNLSTEVPPTQERDLLIPPTALKHVCDIFLPDDQLEITLTDNHITFQSTTQSVTTRLISGSYPNYEQILPKKANHDTVIDRSEFAAALRRVIAIAPEKSHCTKLSFTSNLLTVSVQTPDSGEARDEVTVSWDQKPFDIGVNTQYLLDILRHVPGEAIRFKCNAAEQAMVIEAAEWPTGLSGLFLLMPIRLNN